MGKKFRMAVLLRLDVLYCAQGGGALFLQTPVVRHTHVLHFSGPTHPRKEWNIADSPETKPPFGLQGYIFSMEY